MQITANDEAWLRAKFDWLELAGRWRSGPGWSWRDDEFLDQSSFVDDKDEKLVDEQAWMTSDDESVSYETMTRMVLMVPDKKQSLTSKSGRLDGTTTTTAWTLQSNQLLKINTKFNKFNNSNAQ